MDDIEQTSLWAPENTKKPDQAITGEAIISGAYRYALWRRWQQGTGQLLWVLVNPSTATGETDDPTLRRLLFYSKRLGFSSLAVGNLFAYRSSSPDALPLNRGEAVGEENDQYLTRLMEEATEIVVGWGAAGGLFGRSVEVLKRLQEAKKPISCLGLTQYKAPKHPLYCRNDAILQPYPPD